MVRYARISLNRTIFRIVMITIKHIFLRNFKRNEKSHIVPINSIYCLRADQIKRRSSATQNIHRRSVDTENVQFKQRTRNNIRKRVFI